MSGSAKDADNETPTPSFDLKMVLPAVIGSLTAIGWVTFVGGAIAWTALTRPPFLLLRLPRGFRPRSLSRRGPSSFDLNMNDMQEVAANPPGAYSVAEFDCTYDYAPRSSAARKQGQGSAPSLRVLKVQVMARLWNHDCLHDRITRLVAID